jgi:hypothetical protein
MFEQIRLSRLPDSSPICAGQSWPRVRGALTVALERR